MINEYRLNRLLGDLLEVSKDAESAVVSGLDTELVLSTLTETIRFLCKEISDQL